MKLKKPKLEEEISIICKKYQMFSKPAEKFIEILKESLFPEYVDGMTGNAQ